MLFAAGSEWKRKRNKERADRLFREGEGGLDGNAGEKVRLVPLRGWLGRGSGMQWRGNTGLAVPQSESVPSSWGEQRARPKRSDA